MTARWQPVLTAPGLDLPEEVVGHEVADGVPEVVAGPRRCRAVGDQRGQKLLDLVAAAAFELRREGWRPGQDPVGHAPEEPAHEGGLVGERGSERLAKVLAEVPGVAAVGQFKEAGRRFGHEQIDIRQLQGQADLGMGALMERGFGDQKGVPRASLRNPGCLAIANGWPKIHCPVQVEAVCRDRVGCGHPEISGRDGQIDGVPRSRLIRDQQAARDPFGMVAQREPTGRARGIALLVVQPQGHAAGLRLLDPCHKRLPFRLVFEVVGEGDVGDDAAEALVGEAEQEHALLFGSVGQRVDDLQDAGGGGRVGEAFGERAVFGWQLHGFLQNAPGQERYQRSHQTTRAAAINDTDGKDIDSASPHDSHRHGILPLHRDGARHIGPSLPDELAIQIGVVGVINTTQAQEQLLLGPCRRHGEPETIPRDTVIVGPAYAFHGLRPLPGARLGNPLGFPVTGNTQLFPRGVIHLGALPPRLPPGVLGVGTECPLPLQIAGHGRESTNGHGRLGPRSPNPGTGHNPDDGTNAVPEPGGRTRACQSSHTDSCCRPSQTRP